jgi:3',5'-cyclic AMP phosphodiesterase CpdA
LTSGAFRPQEGSECRILNAAVRTVNALHTKTPIDFVVLGGDNADNAQSNELGWFLSILDGAPKVECDSGADDDPVPGPDNDGKDPFIAPGLAMPWKWVTGNHDVLNQGNLPTAAHAAQAIGSFAATGTRDWSLPGGPVVTGDVIADPRRAVLSRSDMLTKVHASGDGHGITADMVSNGKAYYTFDVPGGAVRFLVVDSAAETGSADGVIHRADVDAYVKPALDKAKADGKLVVVTSHHKSTSLTDGSGFGGTKQADALTPQQWVDLLGSYDNVIMHLAGHTHVHRVRVATATNGRHFWELETTALADFPFQMRFIEIWDQDDGFVSVRAVPVDFATDGDPVAEDGRKRGTVDYISSWASDGRGDPQQRAVDLWFPKPTP